MSKLFPLLLFSVLFIILSAFNRNIQDDEDVVKIGKHYWTTSNCSIEEFANGEAIPQAKNYEEWENAYENKLPAWCYYFYDSDNKSFGKLYNFHAVTDNRGLAPKGYRIPNREDWEDMIKILGGAKKASEQIKSKRGWKFEKNGTNSSGLNCEPFGFYQIVSADNMPVDNFNGLTHTTGFWSIHMKSNQAFGHLVEVHALEKINFNSDSRGAGAYVRFIKL